MRKFFVDEGSLQVGQVILLAPEESKHAARVLRLSAGDKVVLFNGNGQEARADILDTQDSVRVQILTVATLESPFRIDLIQCELKGPKMDWLVEKATELGVRSIQVCQSDYSVAEAKRTDRWERIAVGAMKQSGNPWRPLIRASIPFLQALQSAQAPQKFWLNPQAHVGLASLWQENPSQNCVLVVGPEGGFSPGEEQSLDANGFKAASLHRNILRGETATLCAVSVLAHLGQKGTP